MSTPVLQTAVVHAHHLGHAATIATPQIRYLCILPVLVMLGGAVVLLATSALVRRPLRATVATVGTVVIGLGTLGVSLWQWATVASSGPTTTIDHAVVMDGFSVLISVTVSCAMILTALIADGYLRREGIDGAEVHVLALVSASGAMIMGEANDLVLIFLGLEILSIALYVLAATNHRRTESGEAALKYFILGSFSSAIFVYGIALTYGATGSTNLTQIADFLSHNVVASNGILLAGLALLLVGFAFKVSAVPFHMWTPDVYQGAPTPITGFMAAVAKAGAFAALLRVFVSTFGVLRIDWQPVVYVLALASLVLGAGLAVVQRDVKRMLAYSSINHAGFILLGVEAASAAGVRASLYYVFTYTFMVIGSFAVVTVLARRGDRGHELAGYRGLAKRQPWLAIAFAVLLLAQAGAPFTTGFLAKFQVVAAAVDAHSVPLAVIAMVTAAVAAFFYLRVAVLMYSPTRSQEEGPGIEPVGDLDVEDAAGGAPAGGAPAGGTPPTAGRSQPLWAGTERLTATATRLNAQLLLDEPAPGRTAPEGGADHDPAVAATAAPLALAGRSDEPPLASGRVPVATAVAIGLCVAVTVVFGIIPAPVVDFARHATLFFVP